jgi:hypothetical protein
VLAGEAAHVFETEGPEGFARFASKVVDGRDSQLYLLDGFKNNHVHQGVEIAFSHRVTLQMPVAQMEVT